MATDPIFGSLDNDVFDATRFAEWVAKHKGRPLHKNTIPINQPFDELAYASHIAMMQPKDKAWRRFNTVIFRLCDVRGVSIKKSSGETYIRLRIDGCSEAAEMFIPEEIKDPVQWFAEHVLGMGFNEQPTVVPEK